MEAPKKKTPQERGDALLARMEKMTPKKVKRVVLRMLVAWTKAGWVLAKAG
jgi:hypothetical protein